MSQPETEQLTELVIDEYLRENPDFFLNRPALLDQLSILDAERGTISLVEIQLKRQREKIQQLEQEITELISIAANNDFNFHQFMGLQETLLKSQSIPEAVANIETFAQKLFLSAHIRLLDAPDPRHRMSHENWQQFSVNHLNGKDVYLGRLKQHDRSLLFGTEKTPELGSYVVLPLKSRSHPMGILAFASGDGGHFQPDMDTLFLHNLTLVFSHLVHTLHWEQEDNAQDEPLQQQTAQ